MGTSTTGGAELQAPPPLLSGFLRLQAPLGCTLGVCGWLVLTLLGCVRVACPNAARLAGTGGSATIAGGHHFHCFVLPAVLYGPGHLPLDTRCVGFSHNGVCGPEVPLLSYRCFTAYR